MFNSCSLSIRQGVRLQKLFCLPLVIDGIKTSRRAFCGERLPLKPRVTFSSFDHNSHTATALYLNRRNYAKSMNKPKSSKGKKTIKINVDELSEVLDLEKLYSNFQRPVDNFRNQLIKHFSLRTSPNAISNLRVTHDGEEYAIQDLGEINRRNPKLIIISFAALPQVIPDVVKAIQASGLGVNPQQDGFKISIPIPKVTTEYRESLAKNAKAAFVKCRIQVKDVQESTISKVKKKEGVSEDLVHSVREQLVAIANQHLAEAEEMLKNKETELLMKD